MYFPLAPDLFPGREDEPSDLDVKMQLIAGRTGQKLDSYLRETLGLTPDVDYQRHANSQRGGSIYFDILTDKAVERLVARAEEVGTASAAERETRGDELSPEGRRP